MFHIDDASLRVRECSSSACLMDHRKTRAEAEAILDVLKATLTPLPQNHLILDEELLRKTDLIHAQAALARRHVITRLPFAEKLVITRDHAGNVLPLTAWHAMLTTLEEGFRHREYATAEMSQATLFQSHARDVLETYRSIQPLRIRYTGWVRYWEGASDMVHCDFACKKLVEEPRIVPELSGVLEQKVLADATVNHCTTCFRGSEKLRGKAKTRAILIPLVGRVRSMDWSITPRGASWALQVQVGDEEFIEPISAKMVKAIRTDRGRWDSVMKSFLSLVFHRGDFSITLTDIFRRARGFTQWRVLNKEPDLLRRVRLLALIQDDPRRTLEETQRMVSLSMDNRDARWPFATHLPGYYQPGKASASTMLNLYDFLINGDNNETYADFVAAEAGRSFPVGSSGSTLTLGKNRLSSYDVNLTLGVFHRLATRSSKLDAFLHTCNRLVILDIGEMTKSTNADGVPLAPLLVALESYRTLRGAKELDAEDREDRDFFWRSSTVTLQSYRAIFPSPLSPETNRTVKVFTSEREAFIHDAPMLAILFFYHAVHELGATRAVDFIEAIVKKTNGLRVKAFMELVATGGFSPDAPPALQVFGLPEQM